MELITIAAYAAAALVAVVAVWYARGFWDKRTAKTEEILTDAALAITAEISRLGQPDPTAATAAAVAAAGLAVKKAALKAAVEKLA